MNFLEAYELNKTKRTRPVGTSEWCPVGSMKITRFGHLHIEAEWEVEKTPEVYVAETVWIEKFSPENNIYYLIPSFKNAEFNPELILNKRTKLTIEVLD